MLTIGKFERDVGVRLSDMTCLSGRTADMAHGLNEVGGTGVDRVGSGTGNDCFDGSLEYCHTVWLVDVSWDCVADCMPLGALTEETLAASDGTELSSRVSWNDSSQDSKRPQSDMKPASVAWISWSQLLYEAAPF